MYPLLSQRLLEEIMTKTYNMKQEYTYWLALANAENIYTRRKNEILAKIHEDNSSLSYFFTEENNWKSSFDLSQDEIQSLLQEKEKLNNYSFIIEDLLEQGYQIIPIFSSDYPKTLKRNLKFSSPILLYTYGNIELLHKESVAIVGSRNANDTSLNFTDNIASLSVSDGLVVVSGYAKGVDRQALDSAIRNGGSSIIVLPQGITTFSSGFKSLYKEISSGRVLVISTFRPNAGWDKGLAMARNQYIYGLAEKIFVAESDSKGGTFSGVQDGLKKNRIIYVRKPNSNEKNANDLLISMGAKPVDINGKAIIENNNLQESISIEIQIDELLQKGEYTTKKLAELLLKDDTKKSQSEIRKILNKKGIQPTNPGKSPLKYTKMLSTPTLF